MARHLRAAIAQVKAQVRQPLALDVDSLARDVGHRWRKRKLTPAVTVALFTIQILHGNAAMTALRHLGGVAVDASSYCVARARLPLALFAALFDAVAARAAAAASSHAHASLLNGRRVLIADVTTFSTPDDARLRGHFSYPPGPRDGCGFPVGRLLGVVDALSGVVVAALGCPLFTHEAREMLSLHPLVKKRDILVADRGFCSYVQIALLLRHGVDSVMRLHQRRPGICGSDQIEQWRRPQRPAWMGRRTFERLPAQLGIRIVRYTVPRKGHRSRVICVATSLLDPIAYPPATIMRLYGHRWNIETCFNHLKTHAGMNALKSRSAAGVAKELMMYLVVWNLVRAAMSRFAARAGVPAWRVSFSDALRWLRVTLQAMQALQSGGATELKLLINPDRPGRWEPRKLKRRLNQYDLLTEPRQNLKAKHRARYG